MIGRFCVIADICAFTRDLKIQKCMELAREYKMSEAR